MSAVEKKAQPEILNMMPGALIDFLWELVMENWSTRAINLVPVNLGFGSVQDIVCETVTGVTVRRVFGFTPVSAHLDVSHKGNQLEMVLAA